MNKHSYGIILLASLFFLLSSATASYFPSRLYFPGASAPASYFPSRLYFPWAIDGAYRQVKHDEPA